MNVMTRRLPREGEITQMTTSIPQEPTKTPPATATKKAHVAKRRAQAAPPKAKPARKGAAAKEGRPCPPRH
jgi:hypothetical protein